MTKPVEIYNVIIKLGDSTEDGITVIPVSSEPEVENLLKELSKTLDFKEVEVLVSYLDPHTIRGDSETLH